MKKFSLLTAVLLLSCAWAVAQTSPSSSDPSSTQSTQNPSTTSPSSTSPSQTSPSSQQPDTSATSSSQDKGGSSIEGCLSGSAGSYTLTDASGTAYQLSGDTSKLSEHVGHDIKVWGESASSGASASSSSSGATSSASSPQTFTVKKVKMVSSSCPNK